MDLINRCLVWLTAAAVLFSIAPLPFQTGTEAQEQAYPDSMLSFAAEENRLVVHNGNITLWFQDYRPMIHIVSAGNESANLGFTVAINGLYEVDGSGAAVAMLDLHRSYPYNGNAADGNLNYTSTSSVTFNSTAETIDVSFSLTGSEFLTQGNGIAWDMPLAGYSNQKEHDIAGVAEVEIVFHVSAATAFVKFDLNVMKWTWVESGGSTLALAVTIDGHEMLDTAGERPSVEGTPVGANAGNETQLEYTVHNTYYRDSVRILGAELIELGYLTWAPEALAVYADGSVATLTVSATMFNCTGNDTAASRLLFEFEVPAGFSSAYESMAYDPVVGLGPLEPRAGQGQQEAWSIHIPDNYLPLVVAAAVVLALIVVSAAALLLVDRKG